MRRRQGFVPRLVGKGRTSRDHPAYHPGWPGMITLKVVEGQFGIDRRKIRHLITLRKLPSTRTGYTILIQPKDLQKVMPRETAP
jgi:hypothetical protein